jgi:hypothetical protein
MPDGESFGKLCVLIGHKKCVTYTERGSQKSRKIRRIRFLIPSFQDRRHRREYLHFGKAENKVNIKDDFILFLIKVH